MAANLQDPYATLGIPFGASRADAARAHRQLAKRYHPDVNPGPEAAERMRRINQAWRMVAASAPARNSTWTTWPEDRMPSASRAPRPAARPFRPEPVAPSFGDRPIVLVAVWLVLGLMYIVGAWLGSISP